MKMLIQVIRQQFGSQSRLGWQHIVHNEKRRVSSQFLRVKFQILLEIKRNVPDLQLHTTEIYKESGNEAAPSCWK
jgi:hypothetical protein